MKNLLLLSTFNLLVGTAFSAENVDTTRLDRIKETGVMVAGYRETSVPFSYLDPNTPSGLGVELTFKILDSVRSTLNRQDIQIRWNPVTLSTRIPMMTTNTIDINCSTDTHTKAREELVSFSISYYLSELSGASKKDLSIVSIEGLKELNVAIADNTTTLDQLKKRLGNDLPLKVHTYPTNRQALKAVKNGEADIYINSDAIIGGELINYKDSQDFKVVRFGGELEPFACMLPKGDLEFKALVDSTLTHLMASGEMNSLYNKWFIQPVHGYSTALNMPMSEALKNLYNSPNDMMHVK